MRPSLRILVPLDGSADAESILPAILPLEGKTSLQVTLLGAVPEHALLHSTESYLERALNVLRREGIGATLRTCIEEPVAAILRHATPEKADLLAMATHGRSGLPRLVLGSVAEEVVRHAAIPLLVSRPRSRMEGWNHVMTLDGSREAESVLDDLLPLTRMLGATLHLLHIEPVSGGNGWESEARDSLERMAARARAQEVEVTATVREGHPGPEIRRYASEVRSGLVAMATHGRTGLNRAIVGSVAEEVLRKVSCPVMLRRVSAPSRALGAGTLLT